jgi:CheY-like chemotaxis protein
MSDLKQLYRQAVAGRVAEIEAALRQTGAESATADESLRHIAHSLRGSGGTYGFPEVSAAAAAAEEADSSELHERTRELLQVLHAVIDGGPRAVRVLIIDDDPEILLLLRTVLAANERELVAAPSGAAAAARLDAGPFALIILDLLLPDVDGREVLKKIRSEPQYADTPVIVLSAKTTPDTRRECAEMGATAFFEKPFDPEAVAAAVGAQLLRVSSSATDSSA